MVSFSPAQAEASEVAVEFIRSTSWMSDVRDQVRGTRINPKGRELLIHAVTGAGKTEVIFQAVNETLKNGGKVLIATPRKDVVLELTPRFQAVFPSVPIISLYGGSSQRGETSSFVIATTHQALNFYRYFDTVIVDEVDAFPFHNNPMLYNAVERAGRIEGRIIYLTATPPLELLQRVRTGTAEIIHIPARYHGHPLVVPQLVIDSNLRKNLQRNKLPRTIKYFIRHLEKTSRQGFIFVPRIEWVELLTGLIEEEVGNSLSDDRFLVGGTYANDPQREEKVADFRSGKIRLIVTTTILERGVTIPGTDCLVLQADAPLFDDSSLVQIAGRVGRSAEDPEGNVYFVAESSTKAIAQAIRQIKRMNRMAKRKGYLKRR